jgi:hypothetical protein
MYLQLNIGNPSQLITWFSRSRVRSRIEHNLEFKWFENHFVVDDRSCLNLLIASL